MKPKNRDRHNLVLTCISIFHISSILGHEGVVEVIKHKCPHNSVKVGDRLTFTIADFCHACERCESDLPQKCFSLFKVMICGTCQGSLEGGRGIRGEGCEKSHL